MEKSGHDKPCYRRNDYHMLSYSGILVTHKAFPYQGVIFGHQPVLGPKRQLVLILSLTKTHEIYALGPDILIAASKIDGSKFRSSKPVLQGVKLMWLWTCYL